MPCPALQASGFREGSEWVAVSSVVEGLFWGLSATLPPSIEAPRSEAVSTSLLRSGLGSRSLTLAAGRETTFAASTTGHWQPHLRGLRPPLCQAAPPRRGGSGPWFEKCSGGAAPLSAACLCMSSRWAILWLGFKSQDWRVCPPGTTSCCYLLTVGWPPTLHPTHIVTKDTSSILTHRDTT